MNSYLVQIIILDTSGLEEVFWLAVLCPLWPIDVLGGQCVPGGDGSLENTALKDLA